LKGSSVGPTLPSPTNLPTAGIGLKVIGDHDRGLTLLRKACPLQGVNAANLTSTGRAFRESAGKLVVKPKVSTCRPPIPPAFPRGPAGRDLPYGKLDELAAGGPVAGVAHDDRISAITALTVVRVGGAGRPGSSWRRPWPCRPLGAPLIWSATGGERPRRSARGSRTPGPRLGRRAILLGAERGRAPPWPP